VRFRSNNRHSQFFKNLIEASRTNESRKAIEQYANSDSDAPPDLSKLTPISKEITLEQEEEIESASPQELSSLVFIESLFSEIFLKQI
jgi:hypothetical protein